MTLHTHLCNNEGIPCVGYCNSERYRSSCGVLLRDKYREYEEEIKLNLNKDKVRLVKLK